MNLSHKTAIVAGGCGLIGSAIVKAFKECGAKAYSLDKAEGADIRYVDTYPWNTILNEYKPNVWVNSMYPENWREHIHAFYVNTVAVADYFARTNGGSIVNIASIYGVVAPDDRIYQGTDVKPAPTEYSAAKGAIIAMTRTIAVRYAKYGVRCNCVSPGGVFDEHEQRFIDQYSARVPMGRMATLEDVAGPVAFLASDWAGYITGQNIMIDGGLTAW